MADPEERASSPTTMTNAQRQLTEELVNLVRGPCPFLALAATGGYRERGNPDPLFLRFAYAAAYAPGDPQATALGLLHLPNALHQAAEELDEKLKGDFTPCEPQSPAQHRVVEVVRRLAQSGGPFVALTVTAAYRDEASTDPTAICVTHATALADEDPPSAALALSELPKILRQVGQLLSAQLRRLAGKASA